MMNKPGRTGLWRILDATRYSQKGLRAAWQHEEAFRQECTLAALMLPLAFWLGNTALDGECGPSFPTTAFVHLACQT